MRRDLSVLVAAAMALAGCAAESPAAQVVEPAVTTATATAAPSSTTNTPDAGDLVGRWAHFDVVAYEGDGMKTLIISYGFNDFTVVDGRLVDTASFCFAEQRTDQPIETSLSDAATQAIRPPATPVEVDIVDGQLHIRRPASPTPVGIRLDDPSTESLPADPDDPRIVDDDGDGKPGITVTIRVGDGLTGELYLARREIFAWEAFLVDTDTITGTVTDTSEQLVLGASDPIFATAGSGWVQLSDLSRSPLVLRRVDPTWDCARLALEADTLFPSVPDIDW
ncbi:MAG: hypothetical protein ACO3C1_00700 [Ilumatobacteraceae bacterium]